MANPPLTFDGENKLIVVGTELGPLTEVEAQYVYESWKTWVLDGNANWGEAFAESVGGNAISTTQSLGGYFFLRNDLGWRIRPDERDHTLLIDGNLFGHNPSLPSLIPTIGAYTVAVRLNTSSIFLTEKVPVNVPALSTIESTQLSELWQIRGLDPLTPVDFKRTGEVSFGSTTVSATDIPDGKRVQRS